MQVIEGAIRGPNTQVKTYRPFSGVLALSGRRPYLQGYLRKSQLKYDREVALSRIHDVFGHHPVYIRFALSHLYGKDFGETSITGPSHLDVITGYHPRLFLQPGKRGNQNLKGLWQ